MATQWWTSWSGLPDSWTVLALGRLCSLAGLHICGAEVSGAGGDTGSGSSSPTATLCWDRQLGCLGPGPQDPSVEPLARAETYFTLTLPRHLASSQSQTGSGVLSLGWIDWSGEPRCGVQHDSPSAGGFCQSLHTAVSAETDPTGDPRHRRAVKAVARRKAPEKQEYFSGSLFPLIHARPS